MNQALTYEHAQALTGQQEPTQVQLFVALRDDLRALCRSRRNDRAFRKSVDVAEILSLECRYAEMSSAIYQHQSDRYKAECCLPDADSRTPARSDQPPEAAQ